MKILAKSLNSLIDVLAIWLQSIESTCGLDRSAPTVRPTREFLARVAADAESIFGRPMTLTQAWQLWRIVLDRVESLRREAAELSDIAFWFKLDPWTMPQWKRAGLRANIPRVQAQAILHSGTYDSTDYKNVYALVLLATGDEQLAQKAKSDAMERLVEKQTQRRA